MMGLREMMAVGPVRQAFEFRGRLPPYGDADPCRVPRREETVIPAPASRRW